MRRRVLPAIALALLLAAGASLAASPLPGIPVAYQPYRTWHRVNAKPILPTPTTAHQAAVKNVYASKPRVGGRYPAGTIVVKEGLSGSGSKRFVSLIAAMQKRPGADPAHGNWVFVEWARASPTARFSEVARDATCWGCHGLARKRDWVFTRR
jgi:hypothetical protein